MGRERHEEHEHEHEHDHHDHDHEHHEHHDDTEGPRGGRGGRGMRGPRGPLGHHRGRGRFGGERGNWGGTKRMRRGDIRLAILSTLREEPAHGYEVMRRLEDMSGGLWRPSPGSVYPHLQLLEDEGMVESSEKDGTRTFKLTEAGKTEAATITQLPWDADDDQADQIFTLRQVVGQLMGAAKELSGAGEPDAIERGIEIIRKARKEIYAILAED
jgi:DNA-binding PadR family transcriptional regulator